MLGRGLGCWVILLEVQWVGLRSSALRFAKKNEKKSVLEPRLAGKPVYSIYFFSVLAWFGSEVRSVRHFAQ